MFNLIHKSLFPVSYYRRGRITVEQAMIVRYLSKDKTLAPDEEVTLLYRTQSGGRSIRRDRVIQWLSLTLSCFILAYAITYLLAYLYTN